MRSWRLLALLVAFPLVSHAEPFRTKHVTAELLLENESLQPGAAGSRHNWIGLRLEMAPHWHTYWRFPGDSGLPTEVEWKLPRGWKASAPRWPTPQRIFIPPLVNYGYENAAVLGFELEIPAGEPPGTKQVSASVSWLVCKEECIPEKGELTLAVKVAKAEPKPAIYSGLFKELRAQQPSALPSGASVKVIYKADQLGIEVSGMPELVSPDFLPLAPQIVKGDAEPKPEFTAGKTVLLLEKSSPFDKKAKRLPGVLLSGAKGTLRVYELDMELPPEPAPALASAQVESPSAIVLVLFAFLGGLILNLMPCVFPVLGIKVMSLVKQGAGDPRHARRHGHAYALGVLACFWALASALLILRSAGQSVGWGFQLQHPGFVTFLIFLFSLVAADLAGFIDWSGRWMGAGSSLANREGSAGSFFTGVLAVVVATPCSAPFMGTAIGAAIGEPAWIFFLVFTALGIGLALPFVLLCYQPKMLKALPKPGAWMERIKEAFAFPIVATVLWLIWVLTIQIGADGALKVELGLLILMVSVWARRRFASKNAHAIGWLLLGLGCMIASVGYSQKAVVGTADSPWKLYSEAALAEALEAGKPVFVDFTAAWCLTCQVNKKLVLDRESILEHFRKTGVVLLLADWTNRDPAITKALERQGRIGVPLYLAYEKGRKEPVVLPQVLTEGVLREAFP